MANKNVFRFCGLVGVAMVCAAFVTAAPAELLDWQLIVGNPGNPGNTAHTTPYNYGAVDHWYWIAKYAVTAGEYTNFLNAVAQTDPHELYTTDMTTLYGPQIERSGDGTEGDPYTYEVSTDLANRPVNFVNWGNAARYANWMHHGAPSDPTDVWPITETGAYALNGAMTDQELMAVERNPDAQFAQFWIPTADEWYKAAFHKNDGITGNYYLYPTGSDTPPTKNDAVIDHSETMDVDSFSHAASPYGTLNQGGNVHEWNDSIFAGNSRRGKLGGFFSAGTAQLHADHHSDSHPTYKGYEVGFRLAGFYIPEPGTATMLLFGAIAALLWRRRR